jgi:hypothetical protein
MYTYSLTNIYAHILANMYTCILQHVYISSGCISQCMLHIHTHIYNSSYQHAYMEFMYVCMYALHRRAVYHRFEPPYIRACIYSYTKNVSVYMLHTYILTNIHALHIIHIHTYIDT